MSFNIQLEKSKMGQRFCVFLGKNLEKLNQNANFWNLLTVALNININTQNK